MGSPTPRRWIAAAVLAAGVVGAVLAVRGCDETEPSQSSVDAPAKRDVAPRRATRRHAPSPPAKSGTLADGTGETNREGAPEAEAACIIALQVRVEDRRDGVPIVGARIEVNVVGYDTVDHTTSGEDGERSMPEPGNAILRVRASATDYDEAVTSVRTAAAQVAVILRLAPVGRLTGVVQGPDGAAPARALILFAPESVPLDPASKRQRGDPLTEKSVVRVLTNDQGMYAAEGLAPRLRYHAFAREFDTSGTPASSVLVEGIVLSPDAPNRSQDFVLQSLGRLVVHAPPADGGSSAQVSVTVAYADFVAALRSDGDGRFVTDRLPPGPMTVTCRGAHVAERDAVISSGETTELTLDPRTPTTVRGVVIEDTGRPVPNAEVEVRRTKHARSGWDELTAVRTDASGTFTALAPKIGSCTLTATAAGFRTAEPLAVVAPADDVRVVVHRAAVLTFTGTTREVTAVFDDERSETATGTGAEGTVRIECEPIGDTHVRIYSAGFAPVVRRATLTAGVDADLGEIQFVLPRTVGVRVADAAGRPAAGAAVAHDDTDSKAWNQASFAAGADGVALVPGAPPTGPLPLRVHKAGFLDLRTIVEVRGDAPVSITLTRGGLLWGEAADTADVPLPDATIRVLDARGAEAATLAADRHGQFDVRLAPGRYTVRADGCDDVAVELREGADEHVKLIGRTR